jgi:hypothetical protein
VQLRARLLDLYGSRKVSRFKLHLIAETLFKRYRVVDMQAGNISFAALCATDRDVKGTQSRITINSVFGERDFSN